MKMYKFTLDDYREKLKIIMDVYDVEETPKTYKIVNGYGNVYESAIRKDELDTVDRFYGARMFSLSPDKSAYIKKLIDRTEEKLVIAKSDVESLSERKEELSRLYEMALKEEGEKTCKACGRPIVWIRTTKGKSMPCDAEPVAYKEIKGGKEKIVTPNGEVISCTFDAKPEEMTGIGYIPHWSTCPQANSFRKR